MDNLDYLIVFALGALIGVTELLSRYKDSHAATLIAPSALFYVLLNGIAAILALYLMFTFGWATCNETGCTPAQSAQNVILAGLGGMAVLRAAVMSISVQGAEVPVGPAALIQVLLNVADRGTDRIRATTRGKIALVLMNNVDFQKAFETLPAACFALMQNVTAEEQEIISQQVGAIANSGMPDKIKSVMLGLTLMPVTGEAGLKAAVDLLGDEIKSL